MLGAGNVVGVVMIVAVDQLIVDPYKTVFNPAASVHPCMLAHRHRQANARHRVSLSLLSSPHSSSFCRVLLLSCAQLHPGRLPLRGRDRGGRVLQGSIAETGGGARSQAGRKPRDRHRPQDAAAHVRGAHELCLSCGACAPSSSSCSPLLSTLQARRTIYSRPSAEYARVFIPSFCSCHAALHVVLFACSTFEIR